MPDTATRAKYQPRNLPDVGYKIGFLGTSLVQQNDAATSAKIAHNGRGWTSWARVLSRNIFFSPIWNDPRVIQGWEPSGTYNATRYFQGLNAGVSGQTTAQVSVRRKFLSDDVDVDIVVIDAGTNDVGSVDKDEIQGLRQEMADYFLNRGKIVILLPILARGIASWASGSAERKRADYINSLTRDFVRTRPNCYLFDWNEAWVDSTNSDGAPVSGYAASDGIHFAPRGGYAVGKAFAAFLARILPVAQPRVWSANDLYDATENPRGNLLTNPFLTGTSGALTNATGSVATGMRVERSSGTSTVVASKETRSDNRGYYQVITITAAGTGENLIYFRTSSADTTHGLAAGTWVQASVEVDVSAYAGYRGISLYCKDNGTNGLISYGLEPFDNGSANELFPSEAWVGTIVTPPFQLVAGSTTLRWRVEIRIDGAVAGTPVVKVGAVEVRPVGNPLALVSYRN